MRYQIRVEQGDPSGAVFDLAEGAHLVGRDEGVLIRLRAKDVSRSHLKLRVSSQGVEAENLSQYGTRLDAVALAGPVLLRDGQRLRLGNSTVLVFHAQADAGVARPLVEAAPEAVAALLQDVSHEPAAPAEPDDEVGQLAPGSSSDGQSPPREPPSAFVGGDDDEGVLGPSPSAMQVVDSEARQSDSAAEPDSMLVPLDVHRRKVVDAPLSVLGSKPDLGGLGVIERAPGAAGLEPMPGPPDPAWKMGPEDESNDGPKTRGLSVELAEHLREGEGKRLRRRFLLLIGALVAVVAAVGALLWFL